MIVEEITPVREDEDYIRHHIEGFCNHCGDEEKFARILYVEDAERTFIYGDLYSEKQIFEEEMILGRKTDFSDFISEHKPQTFNDCLFLFTIYWRRRELRIDEPMKSKFSPDILLDDLWSDSKGYLIWFYQIEAFLKTLSLKETSLLASVQCSSELRHLLSKQDLERLCLAHGKDVTRIFNERMLFDRVRQPMVKPALRLCEALCAPKEKPLF